MRTAILSCLFAVFGYSATAQLSLLPQVGIEDFRTSVKYNGSESFSPLCLKPAALLALRANYNFRNNHGPWMAVATSRPAVEYSFTNPETGLTNFTAGKASTQLRLEAGYQLRSKPIFFKQQSKSVASKGHCQRSVVKSHCGSKATLAKKTEKNKGAWMRLAPSAGMAFAPWAPGGDIESKTNGTQTLHTYNAGSWRTAMVAGLGFEFGKNERPVFNLSLNYLKGFGNNMDTKSMTTVAGNKTSVTTLSSGAAAWNLKMGIPINLSKKKAEVKEVIKVIQVREVRRCGVNKTEYKSKCSRFYNEQ